VQALFLNESLTRVTSNYNFNLPEEINMSVSAVSPATIAALTQPRAAPDGDSPAVEAKESSAVKLAEKANGGVAPKPAAPVATTAPVTAAATAPATTGVVNKLV
jgi:hypothetical protein